MVSVQARLLDGSKTPYDVYRKYSAQGATEEDLEGIESVRRFFCCFMRTGSRNKQKFQVAHKNITPTIDRGRC